MAKANVAPLLYELTRKSTFRYVLVYLEHSQASSLSQNSSGTPVCFEPTLVHLQRTGSSKIVTISALISHFLPYFNSSINPIIYNIMSGKADGRRSSARPLSLLDRFRLKFRELFSSCCCCCKSASGMKSPSSTTLPFKASSINQHTHQQQPSPMLSSNSPRYLTSTKSPRLAHCPKLTITNSNPLDRHAVTNSSDARSHNGTVACRLTNV